MIKIIQHNILAPLWLDSNYKQLPCYKDYIDSERWRITVDYLLSFHADIYFLSEVEFNLVDNIAGVMRDYRFSYVSHDGDYWSEWLEDGEVWRPNGNVIAIRRHRFDVYEEWKLRLDDGCSIVDLNVKDNLTDLSYRLLSIHFDTGDKRKREIKQLLCELESSICCKERIILSGDFNQVDVSQFISKGFVETVDICSENSSTPLRVGVIDHTLAFPLENVVYFRGDVIDEGDFCSTVQTNGSDHYSSVSCIIFD